MQVLVEHELKDIIRLEEGVILEIHKYQQQKGWVWIPDYKNKLKKLSGIKDGYIVKEEFINDGVTFERGAFILGHFKTIPITDKNLFKVELKSSGGSIHRSFKHMNMLMDEIKNYINTNY